MTQSGVYQKYKLSVVSGGKPILPRDSNTSNCNKSQVCLTPDEAGYIVPFNNQIKIYSVETRQCIKTLKYGNNKILSKIFTNEDTHVAHIVVGDITSETREEERQMTVFTNDGNIIVLNYKGKLVDTPKYHLLLLSETETVCKVFEFTSNNSKVYKLLTTQPSATSGSQYTYRLYSLKATEEMKIELEQTYENVMLSTWSKNDKFLALLYYKEKHKCLKAVSLFDKTLERDIDAQSILGSHNASSASSLNSRYVTSMALDATGTQLALGFASGVINIVSLSDLQSRLLKWHIDSVLSLSFTQDGTYLLSGGWEKVLCFWQLSTNLQQFLPRLNGVIIDCEPLGSDKYYSLALQMTDNTTNSDYQLLLLNAADLTSKVSVNGPLPVFNSAVKNTVQPFSAVLSKSSTTVSAASNSKRKHKKKLLKSKRQDFTACAEINPLSKHIFFPHVSAMQTYDFYKNEQVSYQYLASGVSSSMGKVRYELNIKEPELKHVKFTKNGKWMLTYEVEYPPEDLLSSKDFVHTLKFWFQEGNDTNWILKTKVINPHSIGVPVTKILSAPLTVNNSHGFITADNAGGLKFWSFEDHENNWCLTKLSLPNFNQYSNSISLAWSQDGSLIFHGFEEKLFIIDFDTFAPFESSNTKNEFNLDSEIQAIKVIHNTNLIVATRTTLNTINLLQGQMINGFDLYPYVNGIYKNGHLDRLIACDEKTGRIALVVNQQYTDEKLRLSMGYKARIVVFNADLSKKLNVFTHEEYISWIGWNYSTDFIFVDIESRLGVVGTTINTEMLDEADRDIILDNLQPGNNDFREQLQQLSSSKHADKGASYEENDDNDDAALEFINGNKNEKLINMNSFTTMFENIQNVQMDTLFDRVMKVIT